MSLDSYGVIHQNKLKSDNDSFHEMFQRKGFVILPSEIKNEEMTIIADNFEEVKNDYSSKYFENKKNNFSIRGLFSFNRCFLNLARNEKLNQFLKLLFDGVFILNQQNGLINSPTSKYSQAKWHRDLPYQHFVSSKNIAINVIYCIDKFIINNGSTLVLPYSHLFENFPSDKFVINNELPIIAKPGDFIVVNAMTFHKGGINKSSRDRRGINSLYSIPYIRHQIDLASLKYKYKLSKGDKDFLGFQYSSIKSIENILE